MAHVLKTAQETMILLQSPDFRLKVLKCAGSYLRVFYHVYIVSTLTEEQPLRLLLNLLLYHFNRSEPTYKSQRIVLLHVSATCSQLNVNALN